MFVSINNGLKLTIPLSAKEIPKCLNEAIEEMGLNNTNTRLYTNAYFTLLNKNDENYNKQKEIYEFYIAYCDKFINERKRGSVMDARFHKKRLTDSISY